MINNNNNMKQLFDLFADLLVYPDNTLDEKVETCYALLSKSNPGAASEIVKFRDAITEMPPGKREELYTATFDVKMVCFPYAGYQMFGESYKRGEFLAKLKDRYIKFGFSEGDELPDHIAVILRFISHIDDEEEASVLINDCLIPVIGTMRKTFTTNENPYGFVLGALVRVLETDEAIVMTEDNYETTKITKEHEGTRIGRAKAKWGPSYLRDDKIWKD